MLFKKCFIYHFIFVLNLWSFMKFEKEEMKWIEIQNWKWFCSEKIIVMNNIEYEEWGMNHFMIKFHYKFTFWIKIYQNEIYEV